MVEFFLRRPIFASVCSLVVVLAGAVVLPTLPVAQYPKIAPPVVTVTATFTGASAEAVEASVTTPLEQAINGVEGLRYITSTSSNDGQSSITCTFELGRDLDRAASDVQNAVNTAQGRLPAEVKLTGVTVNKNSSSFIMALALTSSAAQHDALFLSNYADLYIKNSLKRIKGVGDIRIFGERKYAMRLWLDPRKLADRGLAASDVVNALTDQNVQVAAGSIGQPPTNGDQPYQISVRAVGRLRTPAEFRNLVLRATPDGGFVRLSDVGRAELGAENYATRLSYNGRQAVGIGVLQLPTANALSVSQEVRSTMDRLSRDFPAGMRYTLAFDSTMFVDESIREVVRTLFIAIVLVVFVIYLFLQDWRTTLIPAITIPISLIGTFALIKALGFSINTLTLFGLTLASGLVVDDAIVVIENISRFVYEKKMAPFEAARAAMAEILSAVLASSLVLLAVFVPVAFFPGTTGLVYKQFALTIASCITISLFNAVTLTPALSALFLGRGRRPHGTFWDIVNRGIAAIRTGYGLALPKVLGWRVAFGVLFVVGLVATGYLYRTTPTGFVPDEDQGFFIVTVQGPEGVSIDYTRRVTDRVEAILRTRSEIKYVFDVNGFSFSGSGPNRAIMFARLSPWAERKGRDESLDAILASIRPQFFGIREAQVFAFNPPAIQGVGNFGGFQFELEDRANIGLAGLSGAAFGIMRTANADPGLRSVFTTFRTDSPQLLVTVDRLKAQALHVPLNTIFTTMQTYLGSVYVNDFDYLSRSYRVYVEADTAYRSRLDDLNRIYVRSQEGGIMPLTTLMTAVPQKTAPIINHYNLFRSIEINGQPAAGYGSGYAIEKMKDVAARVLPSGVSYEWSGISLEQIESGGQAAFIFLLGIVFVFLVLSAQYENFLDPFIILLAVPLAIFGALVAILARGLVNDVFSQIGFVMLIGLASKNSILIVEFANQLRRQGVDTVTAVKRAAETRLRPILMTSFAFILGIMPLVVATGAGSATRHSLGTAIFGGMIVSTVLNLFIVPVLYVLIVGARERLRPSNGKLKNGKILIVEEDAAAAVPQT